MLAACGSTTDVTLALTDDNHDCDAAFALVSSVSIEIVATNGRCRLAHTCADRVVDIATLADMTAALQSTDVLLELSANNAQVLAINGRPLEDCFPREDGSNSPVLCGSANLSAARDGVLAIEMVPDQPGGVCAESLALCP